MTKRKTKQMVFGAENSSRKNSAGQIIGKKWGGWMTTDETLNELLVRLFKDIMEIEGKCLITEKFKDLSYNDFHVIEAIGMDEPKTMSTIAKLMNVTTGTLTKAMDGLTRKEYVVRERSEKDKRVVWVRLTEKGEAAYRHHEAFHREMISQIKGQLTEQETPILIYALAKLTDYFHFAYKGETE